MVEAGDPDRFLSGMTARVGDRARLWPLYAFNLEIARAPWASQESMIAEMRLQWWRDTVEQIGAGMAPQGHEVIGALAVVVAQAGSPVELLDRMIVARRWDIYHEPFEDMAAFEAHIDATSGGLMWLAALALGAGPGAEAAVRGVGYAAGVASWLRAVPELQTRGRVPLVGDVVSLAQGALARLATARGLRATVPARAAPALLAGWQAGAVLRQVVAEPGRVAAGALGQSEFARRGGLVWRSALGRW